MVCTIEHARHQHAAGHGFFHSGSIKLAGSPHSFEYVYDCGARKRKDLLHPLVEEYALGLGMRPIDMLVVSHLHADHVSGLERLLLLRDAKLAVIPYVDIFERLLIVGARLNVGTATAATVKLTLDPAAWLKERGVERVVTISPGLPPGEAAPDGAATTPDAPKDGGHLEGEWKLTAGVPTKSEPKEIRDAADIPHDVAFALANDTTVLWEFKFFCWRARSESSAMREAIAGVFKIDVKEIETNTTPDWVLTQLKDPTKRKDLVACYRTLRKKHEINWTSLCLRSAPRLDLLNQLRRYWRETFHTTHHGSVAIDSRHAWSHVSDVAWLGTGDAKLDDSELAKDFLAHFGDGMPVACMSLPHHGSADNHNLAVLKSLAPKVVYVTCPPNNPHHPADRVRNEVKKWLGVDLVRVDEKAENALREWVRIHVDL